MSILRLSPDHVRRVIDRAHDLLAPVIPRSREADQQSLMTVAAEVGGWDRRKQIGGPALSWWQIEPDTIEDIQRNWLDYREDANAIVWAQARPATDLAQAVYDDPIVAAMLARIVYRRSPEPFAPVDDWIGQAKLWKSVYNTEDGKGAALHALDNYRWWIR